MTGSYSADVLKRTISRSCCQIVMEESDRAVVIAHAEETVACSLDSLKL